MRLLAPVGLAVAALALAACGTSNSGNSTPSSRAAGSSKSLRTAMIHGVTVLTDSKGFTLYWFAPDTPTTSKCTGTCAQIWPPVKGPATAGPGVTGKLGVLTRPDGATQATYDGHPLYTYTGDSAPGQAHGNGLNVSGGVWHEATASGAVAPTSGGSASPSASPTGSGGGGYGY